jgi:hypothetical protein
MKLPKLRAEIRRIEGELKRMYEHARNLEVAATVPKPLGNQHPELTQDAKERAVLLFWRHLTPEQRREFTKKEWFTAKSKRRYEYRISPYRVGRVEGSFVRLFCLVLREYAPLEDQMLAKKIIIERDEDLFLNTAVNQGLHDPVDFGLWR